MGSTKRARARVMAVAVGLGAAVMTGQGFATAAPGVPSDSPSASSASETDSDAPPSSSPSQDSSVSPATSTDGSAGDEPTSYSSGGRSRQTSDTQIVPVTTDTSELIEGTSTGEESPAVSDPEPEPIYDTPTVAVPTETATPDAQSIAPSEQVAAESDSLDEPATSDIQERHAQDLRTDATTTQSTAGGGVPTAAKDTPAELTDIGESTGPVVAEISSMVNAISEAPETTMVASARTVAPEQTISALTAPITPQASLVFATGFFLWLGIPPLGGTVPVAPPPPAWALLSVVRRFIDDTLFNSAPIVTLPPTVNAGQDAVTGAITGTINVADANNDRLVYTVTRGSKGTAVVNPDGTFVYTPDEATLATGGADSFTVIVSDATNFHLHLPSIFGVHTTQVAVPITVTPTSTNRAPTLQVVAGQTDTQTGVIDYTVIASDPDGDAVTISRTDDVDHGTLTDNGNGSYTYIPDPVYAHAVAAGGPNTDGFTLVASDGQGGFDTATTAIAVLGQNAAPTLVVDAGDPDAVTGAIDYTVTTTDADGDTPTVTTTAPARGSLTDHGNGTYTYTPGNRFASGIDTFTVSVDDGHGGTATELVAVAAEGQYATITVPINGNPNDMIVSPDGEYVLVTSAQYDSVSNSYIGTLTVIDTTTPTPTSTTTTIDGIPIDLTVTADGDHVLVTSAQYDFLTNSYTDGTFTVVDTTTPTPTITTVTIVGRPTNTIISADGDFAFVTSAQYDNVTDSYTRTLTVVDTTAANATAIIITTIDVYPNDLIVTADGDHAFVTTYLYDNTTGTYTSTLILVDTTTPTPTITTVAIDGYPNNLTVTADGDHALVTSELYDSTTDSCSGGSFTVVDTTTPTPTITTITIGGQPTKVIFSADGDHAFITSVQYDSTTDKYNGTLTAVDTTTPTPTITTIAIAIDGQPTNTIVSADGNYVFVTSERYDSTTESYNGTLTVVDTTTPTPTITTIAIDGQPADAIFSADGDYVFVTSEQYTMGTYIRTLTVVDTTTPTPTITTTTMIDGFPTIRFDARPANEIVNTDGNYVFVTGEQYDNVANRYSGTLTIVDTTTPTPTITTVTIDSRPHDLTVTTEGDYAFVTGDQFDSTSSFTYTLNVVDNTTPTPTIITTMIGYPSDLTVTADGNYAFLTSYQNDETTGTETGALTVVDTTTSTPTITTTAIAGRPTNAVVSTDGKYVFVTSVQYDNVTNTYSVSLNAVALSSGSASTV